MGATCTRAEGDGREEQVDWIERGLSPDVKFEPEIIADPHPDLAPQPGLAVPQERLIADEEPSSFRTGGSAPSAAAAAAQPSALPSASAERPQSRAELRADEELARRMQEKFELDELQARQLLLMDQPLEVLKAYAQELGISAAGISDRGELASLLLALEYASFQTGGSAPSGAARPQPSVSTAQSQSRAQQPSVSTAQSQNQAQLLADEQLARGMQEQQSRSSWGGSAEGSRRTPTPTAGSASSSRIADASVATRRAAADSEENNCMVCLEQFQAGENLRFLPCLHRYHRACIEKWLQHNLRCPVCKHDSTHGAG